jgi:hypothetical protein
MTQRLIAVETLLSFRGEVSQSPILTHFERLLRQVPHQHRQGDSLVFGKI